MSLNSFLKFNCCLTISLIILFSIKYASAKCELDKKNQKHCICANDNLLIADINKALKQADCEKLTIDDTLDRIQANEIQLPNLRQLEIKSRTFRELDNNAFANLGKLQYLMIGFNKLKLLKQNALNRLTELKKLEIISTELNKIDSGAFSTLINLKELTLWNNKLKTIPNGLFDRLSNLEILEIKSTQISELPEGTFLHLYNLKNVDFTNNKFKLIPRDMFKTQPLLWGPLDNRLNSKIERLDLTNNRLNRFDQLENLPKLKFLSLSGTYVGQVSSDAFNNMRNLEELDLTATKLTQLDHINFDNLSKLKKLKISVNSLTKINGKIFQRLKGLEEFHASYNKIENLTLDTFNYTTKLQILSLVGNEIQTINSAVFDTMENLKTLELPANKIKTIESGSFFRLRSLISLDLNGNKLNELKLGTFETAHSDDAETTSPLLILNLGSNLLNELKSEVFKPLKNLRHLILTGNKISTIPEDFFKNMYQLESLHLNRNLLKNLPSGLFIPVGNTLLDLRLEENIIEKLERGTFEPLQQLVELNLRANSLTGIGDIDPDVFNVPSLKLVILNHNKIEHLPIALLKGSDCNIEELRLYGNRLTFIEDEFFDDAKLKKISIEKNPWICKCLDNTLNVLRRKKIDFHPGTHLNGQLPSCMVSQNNTCNYDLNQNAEIFRKYNQLLEQYPKFFCLYPDLC